MRNSIFWTVIAIVFGGCIMVAIIEVNCNKYRSQMTAIRENGRKAGKAGLSPSENPYKFVGDWDYAEHRAEWQSGWIEGKAELGYKE